MGRYLFTWIGLFLFVAGISVWLFPFIPSVPQGDIFQPHLVIPTSLSLTLVAAGIVLMLLTRTQDDPVRR